MITRKLGKVLRGGATPFQVVAASVLASLIAFVPGFAQAPRLMVFWVALLVLFNANLFLAGLVGLGGKLVALLLAPLSFGVGRFLLEGPTRGLFSELVNAPVFAWFGFDYFLVTGGVLVGLIVGLAVGFAVVVLLRRTWRKLADLEGGSTRFKAWSEKRWIKVVLFIFVGGVKGKKSYDDLLARTWGNPLRPLGLVLVVLLGVLGYVGAQFFDSAIVTAMVRSGLERANGATVDLESADVALADGRVVLNGLAVADPDKLETNLLAAKSVEAKLSTSDLLRKRAVVDSVVVSGATQGERRAVRGVRIGPEEDDESKSGDWKFPDMQSIEDIMENADVWKERLATVRRWLDRLKGQGGAKEEPGEGAGPSYEERLRERVRLLGYANVRDETLIEKSPRLLIRVIEAEEVRAADLPDDPLNIRAENLSTEPHLVDAPPTLRVASKSGRLLANVAVPSGADPQLELSMKALSIDDLVAQLKASSKPALQGGTLDFAASGVISGHDSNLPITFTLHDTHLALGGSKPTALNQLAVAGTVRGPINNPAIKIDAGAMKDALVESGKQELSNQLQSELQKKLGKPNDEGSGKSDDLKKAAGKLLDGFLKGRTEPEKPAPAPGPNPP